MAAHDQVAHVFVEGVFFAHAGNTWLRPTNENTNRAPPVLPQAGGPEASSPQETYGPSRTDSTTPHDPRLADPTQVLAAELP